MVHPGGSRGALGRILCAIDLEKASERAFDRALSLAIIGHAKLFILHATPAKVPFSWRASERLEYLTELRERAEAAGVKVRVEEQHGDPAGLIVLQPGELSKDGPEPLVGRGLQHLRDSASRRRSGRPRHPPAACICGRADVRKHYHRCGERPALAARPPVNECFRHQKGSQSSDATVTGCVATQL
jgi:hypothetical protein